MPKPKRYRPPKGITKGFVNSRGFRLYTDGERFIIGDDVASMQLNREEMAKVIETFGSYFSGHHFGIVED